MSVTSNVLIRLTFTGDVDWQQDTENAPNASANAQNDLVTLANGFNAFTVPTSGAVPNGVVVIPPASNTTQITLKGVTGDTGVLLHKTNPTYISLGTTATTFGLTVSTTLAGVRMIYT